MGSCVGSKPKKGQSLPVQPQTVAQPKLPNQSGTQQKRRPQRPGESRFDSIMCSVPKDPIVKPISVSAFTETSENTQRYTPLHVEERSQHYLESIPLMPAQPILHETTTGMRLLLPINETIREQSIENSSTQIVEQPESGPQMQLENSMQENQTASDSNQAHLRPIPVCQQSLTAKLLRAFEVLMISFRSRNKATSS